MSKKTVSFAVPATAARRRASAGPETSGLIRASEPRPVGSDAWVKEEDDPAAEPFRLSRGFGHSGEATFVVDLAAERSLTEVIGLSALAPFMLGWFWLVNAMTGRPRF